MIGAPPYSHDPIQKHRGLQAQIRKSTCLPVFLKNIGVRLAGLSISHSIFLLFPGRKITQNYYLNNRLLEVHVPDLTSSQESCP